MENSNRFDLGDIVVPHDIPRWLGLLVMFAVSASVPLALFYYSSNYLTSANGLADGGDMYSHLTEAMHLKHLLQRGETDLWYDGVTLGYPIFLAYQPLACCVTAAFMAFMERYISSFLAFRWLFFLILSAMPFSWYFGTQQLGLTRLQSSLVTLCLFSLRSWVDFGLELSAFSKYGLYTQAYGMLTLPIAAFPLLFIPSPALTLLFYSDEGRKLAETSVKLIGITYQYIIYSKGSRDVTVLGIALNLLSHSIFGIYLVLLTGMMIASFLFVQVFFKRSFDNFTSVCMRALDVHLASLVLCGWWLIPTLFCYHYIGGLPWKYDATNEHNISIVIRKLLSGEIYDFGRTFPFITLGILTGLSCVFLGHSPLDKAEAVDNKGAITRRPQTLHVWLGLSYFASLTLFLGRGTFGGWFDLIPFHSEMESLRYLSGLHFLGLLLFAVGCSCILIHICGFISKITGYTIDKLLVISVLLLAPIYLSNQLENIHSNLTVTEMSEDLQNSLLQLKQYPVSGRLYGNKHFGTEGPWELAFLPYFTRKPGIQTYSRGYHDSLSAFYLESFQPDLSVTPWFPDLMRLFNIRYISANSLELTKDFLHKCNLFEIMRLDNDAQIFIRSPDQVYGYFEFVVVPGKIQGNLKDIRAAVRSVTQIFQVNAVLAINPEITSIPNARVSVSKRSAHFPHERPMSLLQIFDLLRPYDIPITEWTLDGHSISEDVFLENVMKLYLWQPVRSKVLKEIPKTNEYSAIVEIPQDSFSKDFYSTEHLLLKVTYHPYWSCRYAKPAMLTYKENQRQKPTDKEYKKWKEVEVHHVTPNLMSIILPPGRHEVICSYSNPLYQKIGFVIFIFTLTVIFTNEFLKFLLKINITKATKSKMLNTERDGLI